MKHFKHYICGGGVVLNVQDKVLLLERTVERDGKARHEVRLPKGHVDEGETVEQTALREVQEESGYGDLEIIAPLGDALVTYTHKGDNVVRQEFYFLMRLTSDAPPNASPQGAEEALFQPRWVKSFAKAIRLLTYPAEQEVMLKAFRQYTFLQNSLHYLEE